MRPGTVVVTTLCALLSGCGEDEIVARAREAEKTEAPKGAPPQQAGRPGEGSPAEPKPGVPAEPTPAAPGTPQPGRVGAPAPGMPGAPTPGTPEEPKPGIPEQPKPGLPGSPPPISGPTVAVRGEARFDGYTSGKVRIDAFDGDHSKHGNQPGVVASTTMERPGPFTLLVPVDSGKIYVEASIDENGDGRPGPQEPQGRAERYPVTARKDDVTGVTVVMTKRAPPPGGKKDDF